MPRGFAACLHDGRLYRYRVPMRARLSAGFPGTFAEFAVAADTGATSVPPCHMCGEALVVVTGEVVARVVAGMLTAPSVVLPVASRGAVDALMRSSG